MDIYEFMYFTSDEERLKDMWNEFLKKKKEEGNFYTFESLYKEFREKVLQMYDDKILADILRYDFWQEYQLFFPPKVRCYVCEKEYEEDECIPIFSDYEIVEECEDFLKFILEGKEEGCVKLANYLTEVLKLPCGHKVFKYAIMCPRCMKETYKPKFTENCTAILECGHEIPCNTLLNCLVKLV